VRIGGGEKDELRNIPLIVDWLLEGFCSEEITGNTVVVEISGMTISGSVEIQRPLGLEVGKAGTSGEQVVSARESSEGCGLRRSNQFPRLGFNYLSSS
jgi:hypothetical protein